MPRSCILQLCSIWTKSFASISRSTLLLPNTSFCICNKSQDLLPKSPLSEIENWSCITRLCYQGIESSPAVRCTLPIFKSSRPVASKHTFCAKTSRRFLDLHLFRVLGFTFSVVQAKGAGLLLGAKQQHWRDLPFPTQERLLKMNSIMCGSYESILEMIRSHVQQLILGQHLPRSPLLPTMSQARSQLSLLTSVSSISFWEPTSLRMLV